MTKILAILASLALLASCNGLIPPGHAVLDSGITANSGGGQHTLDNQPDFGGYKRLTR